jgi:uncharacterized membrane protein
MKELESLLLDIPLEEREEALQYYNGYFEDAGEDHEDEIIKELGSPGKVASIIKADLNSNAADRETRGYFTEKGYEDTIYNNEKYEIVGAAKEENGSDNQTGDTESANSAKPGPGYSQTSSYNQGTNYNQGPNVGQGTNYNQGPNVGQGVNYNQGPNVGQGINYNQGPNVGQGANYNQGPNAGQGANYNQGPNAGQGANYNQGAGPSAYKNTQQTTKNTNTTLVLVLAIFTFPIWLPVLLSVFGIAIGVVAAIFGIIFGFGIAGGAMVCVGIALFIAGLVQITVPVIGLLMIGSGLFVFGLGMLFILLCVLLCKKVLPAMIRGFVNLCRLPFKNRSVMA